MKTNTGYFQNLFSGLQQYSPENEIRIASVQKKKTVQITCIHREIELTFHVMFIKG